MDQNKYLLEYELNGERRPAEIYADTFEDARAAILAMRNSLVLKGVLDSDNSNFQSKITPMEKRKPTFLGRLTLLWLAVWRRNDLDSGFKPLS